jgi:preprotein translocase SecF subunit
VYHLTRKKYWFFLISALVIVPGLLALIFWHLNPGIDFTNGANVDIRFASANVSVQQVANVFKAHGATDVQVIASTDLSGAAPASNYAFIRFSRAIGTSEATSVLNLLKDPKSKLPAVDDANVHTFYSITLPDAAKTTYALMVVPFEVRVAPADVKAALAKLPDTDAPPVVNPSVTPTPAATAGGTPAATAAATAAPKATATAAATATPTASTATFPVSVTEVKQGANSQTFTVETQTDFTKVDPKHPETSLDAIMADVQLKYGDAYVQSSDEVGPAIASETARNAILAVLVASAFILGYITWAFRHVGGWRQSVVYGACAIIALLHDAFVILGLWAIFGHFFDFKVDTLFVTAVLTVIGFSVHDTIVVFDRVRENLARRTGESFEEVVNASLVQTMSRSLNTSLTVLITLAALTLFGGATIRSFTLALLIGIASGTYSSIFNASMLLVVWHTGEWRRWPIIRSFVRQPALPSGGSRGQLVGAGSR